MFSPKGMIGMCAAAGQLTNQQTGAVRLDATSTVVVRSAIRSLFEQVAAEQERKLATLTDDVKLVDCGLDSLSFAIIVTRLEDRLGVDPFSSAETMDFPVTFGDFVRLYEGIAT
jgi:acyl carrier protein